MRFIHRVPNQFIKDNSIDIRTKLWLYWLLTWPFKTKTERGQVRSNQVFGGFDARIAAENLHIRHDSIYKHHEQPGLNQFLIMAGIVKKIEKGGDGKNYFVLAKPTTDYDRYFFLPDALFRSDLNCAEKMVLIVCFMLRDRHSYDLKADKSLIRSVRRYLGIQRRQIQRIFSKLVEAGFLKLSHNAGHLNQYTLLKHPLFELCWDNLIPPRKSAAEIVTM